jgi:hypothetical protein
MKSFLIKTKVNNNIFFKFKYIVKPKLNSINNLTLKDVIDEMKYIGLNFNIQYPFKGDENVNANECELKFFFHFLLIITINSSRYYFYNK